MKKGTKVILSKSWPEVFEHPQVVWQKEQVDKRIEPSKDEDLAYLLGKQHGWQEAFEYFMDTLPKRVARELKEDERRQKTSLDSDTTTGLPAH